MHLISLIISTYNWPEALAACLKSVLAQHDTHFEILVADDGSRPDTANLIRSFQAEMQSINHIFQQDKGFRAATIRNKAVAKSSGEYLLFIDGDCILFPDFLTTHRKLAEQGHFVPGNRVLLNESFTSEILQHQIQIQDKPFSYFLNLYWQRKINRLWPLTRLPLGPIRHLQPNKWQKAMTCNLGVWTQDFMDINGFDETFEGWGYEDSDLVVRLLHQGSHRKEGRFAAPVLHLWHPENDRSRQDANYQRLLQRLQQPDIIRAQKGVAQYYR